MANHYMPMKRSAVIILHCNIQCLPALMWLNNYNTSHKFLTHVNNIILLTFGKQRACNTTFDSDFLIKIKIFNKILTGQEGSIFSHFRRLFFKVALKEGMYKYKEKCDLEKRAGL